MKAETSDNIMKSIYTTRITAIQNAPFSWKAKDTLTGAEKYMEVIMKISLIEMIHTCFPAISIEKQRKINLIWRYELAAYHLKKTSCTSSESSSIQELKINAAKMYELEAQRILGALFPLDHAFWKAFYKRQEAESDKILIAIDALHFASKSQSSIAYQLLLQAFRFIIKGQYASGENRYTHFKNANKLLADLPLPELQLWLNQQ